MSYQIILERQEPSANNIFYSRLIWLSWSICPTISEHRRKNYEKLLTMMARNPRAPVLRSIANLAIPLSASGVNVKSTLSMPNRIWYWWTIAFFGSVNILINRSWFSEWNGTRTGNLPTNSCEIHKLHEPITEFVCLLFNSQIVWLGEFCCKNEHKKFSKLNCQGSRGSNFTTFY